MSLGYSSTNNGTHDVPLPMPFAHANIDQCLPPLSECLFCFGFSMHQVLSLLLCLACVGLQAAPNGAERFLLYDTHGGEGFSYRRLLLHRALSTAHRLQSKSQFQWVLVIPGFRDRGSWNAYEFSEFYNMTVLPKGLPSLRVMEAQEFRKQHDTVDMLWCHKSDSLSFESTKQPAPCAKLKDGLSAYHRISEESKQVFYSHEMLQYKTAKCWIFDELTMTNTPKLIDQIHKAALSAKSIVLPAFERVVPGFYEWDRKNYWLERAHVRWVDGLERLADAFIATMPAAENYISIHLRRGDFARAHKEDYSTPEEVAAVLHPAMLKHATHVVFMATDGTLNEVSEVQAALRMYNPFAVILTYKDPSIIGNLRPAQVAAVDMIIAARSKYYIGTFSSYFSSLIHFDRKARGFAFNTMLQKDVLVPVCMPPKLQHDCAMLPW